ncbi:hypothetical protein JYU15_01340 [bacterium AH-315-I18]|nr:hypothetical protein [Phycisphaeraceae bacterium]MBN4061058.1 hypothetical protein [bacterium AH-315-I18]
MNQHPSIEQLWDAYRDDDITAADKVLFEQYLADHPDQAQLFQAESHWLESLHVQPVAMAISPAETSANRAFANTVLAQWDEQSKPVLARIHWKSAAFSASWLVAAAAIAIAMWVNAPQATVNQTNNPTVADSRSVQVHRWQNRDHRHPLTSLVQNMDETYDQQPTNVFTAFSSMMNLSNVEVTPIQQASFQEH